jgi:hypothetical protein
LSFAHHVKSSELPFEDEIHHWAKELFLFWLEVLVLLDELDDPEDILKTFEQVISPISSWNSALIIL